MTAYEKVREAALVAYLLTIEEIKKRGIKDSNDLFEYFLIDVDMGTCMMTSRIKQAISSVQLFIQRCLMNLENQSQQEVSPEVIDDKQWEWMKNYRVWEANRKVFLYPENWIEPEFRDNKTPFFRELESEILQDDLTNDSAEEAFTNYLHKLDEVAKLEIVAMYHQQEQDGDLKANDSSNVNLLHVFGRTYNTPQIYYYRKYNFNKSIWSLMGKAEILISQVMTEVRISFQWPTTGDCTFFGQSLKKNQMRIKILE